VGQASKIEWTDATWNPVRGCSRVSPGCLKCYAERDAARFAGSDEEQGTHGPFHGFVQIANGHPQWTGRVELMEHKLAEPQHWKQPKRIFVNSMSDLFHEKLTADEIGHVFKTMYHVNWHTYQILTKRAGRLLEIMPRVVETFGLMKHVWLGVSVENRAAFDERVPLLRATSASVRFLSIEPLLEDLGQIDLTGIDWVIIGGESGPGARMCRMEWVRSIMEQCFVQAVPCFFKQAGAFPTVDFYGDEELREWALSGRHTVLENGEKWIEDHQPTPGKTVIRVHLRDKKGGDLSELPDVFHEREFPGKCRVC
jgi:protein gp37